MTLKELSTYIYNYTNKNGTFTLVTPIINAQNKVTALLFGSARNKDYSYFRLIDRNTPQTYLAEHGDKNATLFTKATLYGIFEVLEFHWKQIVHSTHNSTANIPITTMNNTRSEMYVASVANCWDYSYTYVEAGYNSVTVNIRQCQTNAMYIDNGTTNSVGTGLGATTPVHSGGARGGSIPPQNSLADVKNNLQNPCFKAIADLMINNNLQNIVTNILQKTFNVSPKINLTLAESNSIVNQNGRPVAAQTQSQYDASSGVLNIATYIRLDQIDPAASQEYKASLLIHEIVHAYIFTHPEVLNGLTQHAYMLQNYIDGIIGSLQTFFPSLTSQQAASLALGGLGDDVTGTQAFNDALTKYGFTTDNSSNNYQFYLQQFQYGTIGIHCSN